MARRRYQRGTVFLRGKKGQEVWVGRYLDGALNANGRRTNKSVILGVKAELATKKLARRALEPYLAVVNDVNYRPTKPISYEAFVLEWEKTMLDKVKKFSYRSEIKSQLHAHLIPGLGKYRLGEIDTKVLQKFLSTISPGRQRHIYVTFQKLWKTAIAWGYVRNEIKGIERTPYEKKEARFHTLDEVRKIFEAAEEPYKTLYWLAIETGLRIGELLALRWKNVDPDNQLLHVEKSVWHGHFDTPKTKTGIRRVPLSAALSKHLRERSKDRGTEELLFCTEKGTPMRSNNVLKRHHHPLLKKLGIPRGGFHAFRHASASFMDTLNTPIKIRQKRLGHADIATTMKYTHSVSADERKVSEELGSFLNLGTSQQVPRILDIPNPSSPKFPSNAELSN